ncbi:MAG TPA: hypothetical protein VFK80_02260 [Limnochordia bacterium]|nr:hypothetical protein [Limnochordia bacterium]
MSDELIDEAERVKLQLVAAYDKLLRMGKISESDFAEILQALDRLDELTPEEFAAIIGKYKQIHE